MSRPLGYLEVLTKPSKNNFVSCPTLSGLPSKERRKDKDYLKLVKHSILKIGRSNKECDFLLADDPSISSVHCHIWGILFDDSSVPMCYIKDVSLNGTFGNVLVAFKKSEIVASDVYSRPNFAVKVIKLRKYKVDKEAKILLKLNHVRIAYYFPHSSQNKILTIAQPINSAQYNQDSLYL